ncbi:MAG: hypothetical protein ACXWU1_09050 [Allosphingosinicella sp.]
MNLRIHRARAVLRALAIGVLVVTATAGIAAVAGRPIGLGELNEALPVFAFQAFMVALPFLVLAMAGITARAAWLTGLALTVALWGYSLIDALVLATPERGANIGLGLIMLVSPVLISIACVATARIAAGRQGAA